MGYLSTPYAWRLRSASFAGATIERLQYRDSLEIAIRFADWRGRSFNPKALEIGEDELLVLIGEAIAADVVSAKFVHELWGVTGGSQMIADEVAKAKDELDAQLAQGGKVNVAFGVDLYQAFWKASLIKIRPFRSAGNLMVFYHPAYGDNIYAICNPDIAPASFVVGLGGEHA